MVKNKFDLIGLALSVFTISMFNEFLAIFVLIIFFALDYIK